ncbi:MAG: MogA/MoaB family molybdenum cofactor biosynthesis protein [Candidatus Binatia bacterium]
MAVHEHREQGKRHARCVVVTVSDTRTPATDTSGAKIRELLVEAGHEVADVMIVPDEPARIRELLEGHLADPSVQAIFLNGGTGLAPRDTTFEAVRGLLDKEITGFGELFRVLSFEEIGAAAMLSRATAGIAAGTLVVSMPGSTAAVDLAMRRLLVPELGHILYLLDG